MLPRTLIGLSTLLVTLVTAPEPRVAALLRNPLMAQSSNPTGFPLPPVVPTGTHLQGEGCSTTTLMNAALKPQFQEQVPKPTVNLVIGETYAALDRQHPGDIALATVDRLLATAESGSAGPATRATKTRGFPGGLLLVPLFLGVLLWLLLRGRKHEVVPTAKPLAATSRRSLDRIILTPRHCRRAYAYWEVAEASKHILRQQGGETLAVRLYDVTHLDMDQVPPHSIQQFECTEAESDLHLPINQDDRDYIAEVGYTTRSGQWLRLARSPHVRVPACLPGEVDQFEAIAPAIIENGPLRAGETAAVGLATRTLAPPTTTAVDYLQVQKHSSLWLDEPHLHQMQRVAATYRLEPGLYKIFIKQGSFDYQATSGDPREPWVLLWIYGGRIINQKTRVPVAATWSTLNGYDDSLSLEVLEPTTLAALFIDPDVDGNEGEMIVSIERLST